MRISETKIVQLVESDPPQIVILDEITAQEISLAFHEIPALRNALSYFTNKDDPRVHFGSDDWHPACGIKGMDILRMSRQKTRVSCADCLERM